MSSGFKFPPPPPPPPKADSQPAYHANISTYASPRGDRGLGRGSRGFRGSRGTQGSVRASHHHNLPHSLKRKYDAPNGSTGYGQDQPHNPASSPGYSSFPTTGNSASSPPRPRKPKIEVAPAVPSFGFSLPVPTFSNPPSSATSSTGAHAGSKEATVVPALIPRKRKTNQLGLTPSGEDRESSEDDADEEATLASADGANAPTALQFEYRGQSMSLGTAGDLAAWIAERKKRFPTRARVEEKKAEATRRARERAEAQIKANEARRGGKRVVGTGADGGKRGLATEEKRGLSAAEEKLQRAMEKHLAKAERLKQKIRRHEEQSLEVTMEVPATGTVRGDAPTGSIGDKRDGDTLTVGTRDNKDDDSSEVSTSSDETSSDESDSSDTPTDEIPADADHESQIMEKQPLSTDPPLCSFFARHGRCKYGAKCRFTHKGPERAPELRPERRPKREMRQSQKLSLHQRLVEQERTHENKLVLDAIRFLGGHGYLDKLA